MSDKFWRNVHICGPDECWPWMGAVTRRGYGRPMIEGRRVMATWLALEAIGLPRPDGMFALHSCDNPNCVNPKHLRWGTQLENVEDRHRRGRDWRPKGSLSPAAKLSDLQVMTILQTSDRTKMIAEQYGITTATVRQIRRRKTWKHLGAREEPENKYAQTARTLERRSASRV